MFVLNTAVDQCLHWLPLGELIACSPRFTHHDAVDECLGYLLSSTTNKIILSTCEAWSFLGGYRWTWNYWAVR